MTTWTLVGDIGGTKMAAALVDSNGQILFEKATLTRAEQGIDDVVERFVTLAKEVAASDGARQPLACGVGVPGLIDSAAGEIRYAANLPGARNYPLRQQLESKLRLPVVIDNDLRLHAIGERAFGAARKVNNFLFVAVGTGVGGALWLDGNLYRGAHQAAGEIGHMAIDSTPNAPLCGCGRRGCLEMFASGPAIAARFRQLADEGGLTLDKTSLSLKEIAQWVDQPDARGELARQAIDEGASALGRGLTMAANLLDPERMILGGGVALLGLSWLMVVRRAMRQRTLVPFEDSFVELAGLGDKAALVGGAVLAGQLLPG